MGESMSTPAPTSLPTAIPTPFPVSSAESTTFVPLWLIWPIIIIAIGIMVGLAFVPAGIAKKKGYSYGGFWVFSFFLFIPAIIVAAAIREKASQPYVPEQPPYNQPYAKEQPPYSQAYAPPAPPEAVEPGLFYCTHCGAQMRSDSPFCSSCGARLR